MQWSQLIPEVTALEVSGAASIVEITGVEYDSRRVIAGSVFIAMHGGTSDGNRFIDAALAQGAGGIITDSEEAFRTLATKKIPTILAAHGRTALAQASAAFFHHPEHAMRAVGITGTNGKTTTAFLTESLLQHTGRKTVLIGTIEYHIAGETRPSAHTTPESRDLFALMAEGVARGAGELVMEVSSHALDQGRVEGVGYDAAVFTNLTRDHLDYHQSMEAYFAAKRLLFDGSRYSAPRVAVLNAGDPYTEELAKASAHAGSEVVTYGLQPHAQWRAEELELVPAGARFLLRSPCGSASVQSKLAGEVNVLNLLGALAAAHARGVSFETLVNAIPRLEPVPGRFQPIDAGQPFAVIVDYAHTDDALRNLLRLAKQQSSLSRGRILTMFGCGGDRDRTKRPKMGQAAGQASDYVVITSDNPRSEDPSAIIEEILPGVRSTGVRFAIEPDRAQAIALIVAEAKAGDIVLLAGKGHEKEQILRHRAIHFDDAQVALSALRALGYGEKR
ncbi:MAG TPA: UDP-N-acetylmuramoyl-L-alanyl-D-glutamate--2,6-diaminopimelate ligase [Acidobacteriaceae bacterium]